MYENLEIEDMCKILNATKASIYTHASKIGAKRIGRNSYYSDYENELITNMFLDGKSDEEIADCLPGRTSSAVRCRRQKMNLITKQQWSEEENKIMFEYYPKIPIDDVVKMLPCRTRNAIILHAMHLGISAYAEYGMYTREDYEFIANNYMNMSDYEIGLVLGHGKDSIKNKRNKFGFHRIDLDVSLYSDASYFVRRNNAKWRIKSMEKCGYKSVISGCDFDDVHHLFSFSQIMNNVYTKLGIDKKTFDINKVGKDYRMYFLEEALKEQDKYPLGVCLTSEEHKMFHHIYGGVNNTEKQFENFVNNYNMR